MPTYRYRGKRGGRVRNKRVGGRDCSWLKVHVLLCHCPWILWGPVMFCNCPPTVNCTPVAWCLARDGGKDRGWGKKRKQSLEWIFLERNQGHQIIPALSILPSLYGVEARLFLEEMNEQAWAVTLNYSVPHSSHSPPPFFVGTTEF